ncbi:DUF4185 domain-containing protein [Candidatus Sumerlaeota bacterium]|nr:DUF4185 domain-containing protein [Candidatus Sumerlaeota bacterium]
MKQYILFYIAALLIFGCAGKGELKAPVILQSDNIDDKSFTAPLFLTSFPDDYPVRLVSVEPDPVFKDLLWLQEKGWLGSDAAHSIPLSDNKILWLFGDTLIGTMQDGKRVGGAELIHNTIGIQDTSSSFPGKMSYFWKTRDGKSSDFFHPYQGKHYIENPISVFESPTTGFMLQGELFIFSYRVEVGERDQWAIPTTLIRIPNPQDPPKEWAQISFDLGLGNLHQGFHSGVFVQEPYVYFLGYDDPKENPDIRRAVLARAKIQRLIDGALSEAFEFWVHGKNEPQWSGTPEKLVALFIPGVTETDIQFIPEWGLYLATTYDTENPDICITVAPDLTGPWSKPVSIYKVPEAQKDGFRVSSYAARPHPEFSAKAGELIISYATNLKGGILDPLFTKEGAEIFFPRFIRAQLEPGCVH